MSKSKATIRPVDVILMWDDSTQIILHYVFRPGWGWPDFHVALEQAQYLTRHAGGRKLHSVLDFTGAPLMRPNAIRHFSRAAEKLTNTYQRGKTIIVSANPMLRAVTMVMTRLIPQKVGAVHYVPMLEDAYVVLSPSIRSELETREF